MLGDLKKKKTPAHQTKLHPATALVGRGGREARKTSHGSPSDPYKQKNKLRFCMAVRAGSSHTGRRGQDRPLTVHVFMSSINSTQRGRARKRAREKGRERERYRIPICL